MSRGFDGGFRPHLVPRISSTNSTRRSRAGRYVLMAGIVLVAINLRPSLAAIGPLVADIRYDTGLSNTAFGILTTLPLLAFGIVSALTSLATRRIGIERTLAAALLLLTAGILLRILPSVVLLFAGTALLGIAIAVGNVLLPSLVKRDFPERAGIMTSVYSSAMGLGATIGAGFSVPMTTWFDLGWRGSLGAWALLTAVALAVWLPQLKYRTLPRHSLRLKDSLKDLGRSRMAWFVALFMGLQSLTFYVILAWLPELLQTHGYGAGEAGWVLALAQGVGIFGTLLVPTVAARRSDQRGIVVLLMLMEAVALIGLIFPNPALLPIWASLLGFILGGSFGLALLLIVLRARDAETATELSGMSQSVGYLIAAAGPALFGLVYDVTGTWTPPLLLLVVVLAAKTGVGLGAGKARPLHKPDQGAHSETDAERQDSSHLLY